MFLQFSKAVTNTHSQREKQGKRIMPLRCDSASTGTATPADPLWNRRLYRGMVNSLPFLSSVQTCGAPTHPPQTEHLQREQEREPTCVNSAWPKAQQKQIKSHKVTFKKKHSVSALISFRVGLPVRLILDTWELSPFAQHQQSPRPLPIEPPVFAHCGLCLIVFLWVSTTKIPQTHTLNWTQDNTVAP